MSDNFAESSSRYTKRKLEESSLNQFQSKNTEIDPDATIPLSDSSIGKDPLEAIIRKDPLEGKTVGDNNRYLLHTLLGQGGMGKVYQALDTKFKNKVVAIKLMTSYSSANNKHLTKRFMAEIEAISSLKHPNIIQIFDYGVIPNELPFAGSPFYVMEYFTGETLRDRLTKNKILPQHSLLNIIGQVCVGLKEAHQKGIIHRDLKPDNIFLVAGGAFGEIVKIIDFGIAKNIISDDQNYTKTLTGSFIGTYRYASPEQCRGLSNIDQRTDIYSLGMILYEAISNTDPFDLDNEPNPTQGDWIACHIRVLPKPLKEYPGCENIDSKLEYAVMKCLAKSPQNRFLNIQELQNALANSVSEQKFDAKKHTKASNNQVKNSHQVKRKDQVKQAPLDIVVENKEKPVFIDPKVVLKTEETTSALPNSFVPSTSSKTRIKSTKILKLMASFATLLIVGLGIGGYLLISNQPRKTPQYKTRTTAIAPDSNTKINNQESLDKDDITTLLVSLETQYTQERYEDCYQLAINYLYRDNSAINKWIGNCGLEAAKIKVNTNNYSEAISIAKTIPNTVSNYPEVEYMIDNWSEEIIGYATKVYKEEGKLEEAIKIAGIFQEDPKFKTTIADLISQWQEQEEEHQAIIARAQNLLHKAKWDAAKQEVEKIPSDFAFLRRKAQPIWDEANQNINEIAAAEKRRLEEERLRAAAEAEKLRLEEERLRAAAETEKLRLEEEQLRAAAETEKLRLKEEQLRAAAEAEKLRLEEEQLRAAAEAKKRHLEEEQLRAAAEAEKRHLEEEQLRAAAIEESSLEEKQISIYSLNGEEVPTHIQSIMRGVAARQELEISGCNSAPVHVIVNQLYGFCADSNYRYNAGRYHINIPYLE